MKNKLNKGIVVVGELHQDLYYESDFYWQLVQKIVSNIIEFIKFNPDDLNRNLFEKIVKKGFSETPKKIVGHCYFKRGGNGNNSAEFIAKLGVFTKLISVIGRGSEWMITELNELGINTDDIFQIDEITPVSTIIKSDFTTKIHLAPNLKNRMNFEGIKIEDDAFLNAKILYSTPIAKKFIELFENGSKLGIITAFNIETQKVQSIEQLDGLIKQKFDLFFLNLKDAYSILNGSFSIDQVDEKFKKYAKIRIYTAGKGGSFTRTDNFEIFFPGIEVEEVVDRTGAGDCFAAGFLTKLFELIKDKEMLDQLIKDENREKLKEILSNCVEFATYTAIYKITNQLIPTQKEMEDFIKTFKIK